MEIITAYVRLLSYDEAILVINKMKQIGGDGAIVAGGISLSGDEKQIIKIFSYLRSNFKRFQVTFSPPHISE